MSSSVSKFAAWGMLVVRPALFALSQLALGLGLLIGGASRPWHDAEGWWLIAVLLANVVTVLVLIRLQRAEGKRYAELLPFRRSTAVTDLLVTVLLFVVLAPISTLPNQWLSQLLFGSADATFSLMFRPLPLWAVGLAFLMPLSQAFAELPTYFGYGMPRLGDRLGSSWAAWGISSFFLAFQHIAAPLILDPRFMAWRVGMFLPLALTIGLAIKLRPSIFRFVVVGHTLIDLPLAIMLLDLSR